MSARKSSWIWLVILIALVSVGLNLRHWISGTPVEQAASQSELYTCPMHPQVVQDHPGDCPICGMKLVKKITTITSDAQTDSLAAMVNLSPSQEVLAAVATELVQERRFQPSLSVPGTITYAEGKQTKIAARAMGQIKKLYVNYAGAPVAQGQPLYDYYSPDITAALREARLANSAAEAQIRASLQQASQAKLLALGLSKEQISSLSVQENIPDVITFASPSSGVIMEKMAVEGDWVMPGMTLFDLLDLAEVWVEGVLYESNVSQVRVGDEMMVHVGAYPGETFSGRVTWLAPMLDMMTRTLPFRITLPNPQGKLKPGMFAQIMLSSQRTFTALAVPSTAVLMTGKSNRVWVKAGEGRYNPREVRLGSREGDYFPVLAGLAAAEEVVVQGGYLIDSDSQLRSMGGGSMAGMPGMETPEKGKNDEAMPGIKMPEKTPDSEAMPGMDMPQTEHKAEASQPSTAIYTCPMHPEVISDKPGKCPKCGMNLVKKEN